VCTKWPLAKTKKAGIGAWVEARATNSGFRGVMLVISAFFSERRLYENN